jgi:hypothetical protein
MSKNMGFTDRVIRILAAVIIASLYLAGQIPGTTAIILLIIAALLALTGSISFCPLYLLLGISTRKKTAQK